MTDGQVVAHVDNIASLSCLNYAHVGNPEVGTSSLQSATLAGGSNLSALSTALPTQDELLISGVLHARVLVIRSGLSSAPHISECVSFLPCLMHNTAL